jgi:HAD superfamily hydrolase (TIGR01509 family)
MQNKAMINLGGREMLDWLFFDIGSTLFDESECIRTRVESTAEALAGTPHECSLSEFWALMEQMAKQQCAHPYRAVMKELGSDVFKPWRKELERPFPEAASMLEKLRGRYHLGIIANQSSDTKQHLASFGLDRFFEVVVSSSEAGLAKTDPEIFRLALSLAACAPERAAMIGDRLDNDIFPAKRLGMKTIWVKQGWGGLAAPMTFDYMPDPTISSLSELPTAISCISKTMQQPLIYGTGNPAKLDHMRRILAPMNLGLIGAKETGAVLPDVNESGDKPLENARIKAYAYYEALKRPVFACDSGLYIDGLPDSEQPGVHVRMVGGKRLTDDEMVSHYSAIARRLGGKAIARYLRAMA